jgi:hypothetical protein
MGSVIEGEDVVQDTLAKAFAALDALGETPPLRAWLFRIAHTLDVLRSRAIESLSRSRKHTMSSTKQGRIQWRS